MRQVSPVSPEAPVIYIEVSVLLATDCCVCTTCFGRFVLFCRCGCHCRLELVPAGILPVSSEGTTLTTAGRTHRRHIILASRSPSESPHTDARSANQYHEKQPALRSSQGKEDSQYVKENLAPQSGTRGPGLREPAQDAAAGASGEGSVQQPVTVSLCVSRIGTGTLQRCNHPLSQCRHLVLIWWVEI